MWVDLRSDTVTRPTPAMRRAMAEAEVGDDRYGEDPTANALEERFAALVGKEAAMFVPSGTMGNQIALRLLARPGDALVAGAHQHVVRYEDGAGPANAGVTWMTVDDSEGYLDAEAVTTAAAGAAYHQPRVVGVCIENTHMAVGGRVWPPERLQALGEAADGAGLAVHLDGARLWNASVALGVPVAELAAPATTVMCCLSKGLAAPVGSLLAGPAEVMAEARVARRRLGGAMRQVGVLAAAGLVALEAMRERLAEDHRRARRLAEVVAGRWAASGADPEAVDTNIVCFAHPQPDTLLDHLRASGVLAGVVAPGTVRLVTHVDVDDEALERACRALRAAP